MTVTTQTLIGRITKGPELHRIPGSPVQNVTFTLEQRPALAERGKRRAAAGPLLLRCIAWRGMAQLIAETFRAGDRVIVIGALQQRSGRAAGSAPHSSMELEVTDIGALLHDGMPLRRTVPTAGEPD
ncbi:single-stranded DNA-binding protein [Kitasatospora sp. NPDC088346]|uniref:single-stranded DNA-binding protein n=1 Tax=Kitasatospora sp. NPDC088346 TaxID=3364073 RepID=UPI00380628A3